MKTKKHTGKKVLSVFLAVLMIMTAWVFVAPTEAEAVASNVRGVPAIRGSHYAGTTGAYGTPVFNGTLDRWFKFHNQKEDYVQIYYPSHIYLDKSETLQSAGYFFNVDWHFGHHTDYRILIGGNALGDNSQWNVDGFPNYYTMTNAFSNYGFDASLPNGATGGVYGRTSSSTNFDLRIVGYGHSDQGSDKFDYQNVRHDKYVLFRSNGSNDPNTATIYLLGTPNGTYNGTYSTSGSSFSSYGFQQNYSGGWKTNSNSMFHQKGYGNGDTSSSNYNPGGWPEMEWGVTIYDKSELNTEINTSKNYTNSDGKYTTASWNAFQTALTNAENVLKTRNVTQSQINEARNQLNLARNPGLTYNNFTITWLRHDGTTAKTHTAVWGTSVNCASLAPANTAATQIAGDNSYHQTYVWDTSNYVSTLKNNITIQEVLSLKQEHSYGPITYVNSTNHQSVCSVCGYVKTQAHISDGGKQTSAPSCTDKGEKTYTCTACNQAYKTEEISALGHDFSSGIYLENITGENGTHYQKCIRCDVYGMGTTHGADEKHDWDKNNDGVVNSSDAVQTIAPECEVKGEEKYTCEICGVTHLKEVAATGHNNVAYTKAQAKKCGVYGWSEYWTCTDCGKVWTDAELTQNISNADANGNGTPDAVEIEADAHQFNGTVVSVTTGKNGTHYYVCSLCGNAYGVDGVENATEPHNWGDPTVTDSTCTSEGLAVYKCEDCPETYSETIDKADHTMTKIDGKPAACEVPGNNEYYFCSACKKYYKDEAGTTETTVEAEIIKALEHTWSEHHDYDTLKTAATCQSPAIYNNHCDYCELSLHGQTHPHGSVDTVNGHKFDDFEDIQQNANKTHSYGCSVEGCPEYGPGTTCEYKVTEDVASTCKTQGHKTYECKTCGNGYSDYYGLDSSNHEGEEETRFAMDATCSSNGYTGDIYCLGCGAKKSGGTAIEADPTVHPHENAQVIPEKPATCQTEGYKEYTYCDACRTYITEKVAIAVKDHVFTTYTSNGDGTHTAICDTCDEAVADPATQDGTCTGGKANCVDKAVCDVCSEAYGDVDSTNHKTPKLVAKVDSTCQTEGHEAYYTCEACGEDMEEIETIAVKAHIYGAWISNGDGTHTRTCTTCVDTDELDKATESENCAGGKANCVDKAVCTACKTAYGEVDKTTHKTEAATLTGAYAATCTAPGYTGDRLYDCCQAVKEKGEEIPQLDHKYTVEVENSRVAATCIEKGSVTYKCETCTDTKVQELDIDPKNHASEDTVTVGDITATCTTEGYTGDIYHACCYKEGASASENRKALISKGTVIKVSGVHTFGDAYPEYMVEFTTETNEDGEEVTTGFTVKEEEPSYEEKIAARHDDDKWYHVQKCEECGAIELEACFTYSHTYNCVDTDICEVCEGLCSLTAPLKHKGELTFVEAVEATCEKEGTKAHYKCEYCGKKFFDEAGQKEITKESDLNIPTSGKHEINPDVPAVPNPEKPGTHKLDCVDCDEPVIVECSGGTATCKDKAVCTACNTAYGDLDPANHASEDTILIGDVKETCSTPGYTGDVYYACCYAEDAEDNSKALKSKGEEIPADATQHVIEINDNGDGTHTESCSACGGAEKTEEHEWVAGEVPETASCTEGYDLTYTCRCGATKTESVPATGHDYGSFVTTKEANCTEKGEKAKTCKVCGDTVTEEIAAKGHDMRTIAGVKPTCSTEGSSDYIYCNRCGLIVQESTKLPATGCEDENHDGFCDDCGDYLRENADGTKCNCVCHKQNVFMQFIYKILRFFWQLFGISRTCCSAGTHY